MLVWIVNKLWPLLEPKIKAIVDEAVDRAIKDLSDVAEQRAASAVSLIIDALRKLPVIGGMI